MNRGRWVTLTIAFVITILGIGIYDRFGDRQNPSEELKCEMYQIEEIVRAENDAGYEVYYIEGSQLKKRFLWKSMTTIHVGVKEDSKNFFTVTPGKFLGSHNDIYIKQTDIKELVHSSNKIVPVINKGEQR